MEQLDPTKAQGLGYITLLMSLNHSVGIKFYRKLIIINIFFKQKYV
jgi:hypothetical protein